MSTLDSREPVSLDALVRDLGSPGDSRPPSPATGRPPTWSLVQIVAINLLVAVVDATAIAVVVSAAPSVTLDIALVEFLFVAVFFCLLAIPVISLAGTLWIAAFDAGPLWRRWMLAVPAALVTTVVYFIAMQSLEMPSDQLFITPLVPLVPVVLFWTVAWLSPPRLTHQAHPPRRAASTAELMLLTGLVAALIASARALGGFAGAMQEAAFAVELVLFLVLPMGAVAAVILATALAFIGPPRLRWIGMVLWPLAAAATSAYCVAAMATEGFEKIDQLRETASMAVAATIGIFFGYACSTVPMFLLLSAAGFRFGHPRLR